MTTDWKPALSDLVPRLVEGLSKCGDCPAAEGGAKGLCLWSQQAVHNVVRALMAALFPGCHETQPVAPGGLEHRIRERLASAAEELSRQIARAFEHEARRVGSADTEACARRAGAVVGRLLDALPEIQRLLHLDIEAGYEGDPAARSTMEVVLSYPGFFAIAVHRIAHILYNEGVPLIPRVMAEYAHSLTGIDIHPGARIGPAFFIDHGTGVVIGETAVIGAGVKLYQGVTLGALSFPKDEQGRLVKGIKRHPNVDDGVVIYAGATILGGDTTIGRGSVIGGNVWLTHSVPPYSKVYNRQPRHVIKNTAGPGAKAAPCAERAPGVQDTAPAAPPGGGQPARRR